jgi:photosystem II stability/assembly factor-like uncharacterized protein
VALASALAALVAATGCSSSTADRHERSNTAAAREAAARDSSRSVGPLPSNGPVPAGFVPVSVTALDAQHYWVLGTAPCGHEPCTALVRTSDDGAHFVGLPAPVAELSEAAQFYDASSGVGTNLGGDGVQSGRTVSDVVFANQQDGYAYGNALFVTHDGGATWSWSATMDDVSQVVTSGSTVYALRGGNSGAIVTAPVAGGRWQRVASTVPLASPTPSLAVTGDTGAVLVLANDMNDPGRLLTLQPGGQTRVGKVGCATGLGGQLSTAPGRGAWLVCPTGTQAGLWRSDDDQNFTSVSAPKPLPNSAMVAAGSADDAVLGVPGALWWTADAGGHWQRARTPGIDAGEQWRQVVFNTPTDVLAVSTGTRSRLWSSDDGGHSWQVVSFG